MFTATLLTDPARPSLDGGTVEALRARWDGRDLRWLAPREAAEFTLAQEPADFWETWETCQAQGIDLLLQPAANRRKRLLLADMDSTMIRQECIDELAAEAGVGARVAEITARAMNGELDFEGALRERVGLLQGLDVDVIARVLAERITHMPGGATLVATMRGHGARAVLVSGGFTAFTEVVAADLGFDAHRANTLLVESGRLTGHVAEPILGREAKIAALNEVTAEVGIAPADVIAVGDGANDLGMLELAGTGVALHAKPSVQERAPIRINHGDLTSLLYLQGYSRADFASA